MAPRRRIIDTEPVAGTTLARVDPLSETSVETWARWRADREARELQQRIAADAAEQDARELPIYPVELARRIAEDTRATAPDWRATDGQRGAAWGKLLRLQPELLAEITRQREAVITAILNTLPRHLHASVNELRTLTALLLAGHEAAAYAVGYQAGLLRTQEHTDERGRTRRSVRENRGPLRLSLDDGTSPQTPTR